MAHVWFYHVNILDNSNNKNNYVGKTMGRLRGQSSSK